MENLNKLVQRLIGKLHPSPSRAHFDFSPFLRPEPPGFLRHAMQATNEPAFDEPKTNSIKNALALYESNLSSSSFINFAHSRASC